MRIVLQLLMKPFSSEPDRAALWVASTVLRTSVIYFIGLALFLFFKQ